MEELRQILDAMDVPKVRKDLTVFSNLCWLARNLWIRNSEHPEFQKARRLIIEMMRSH
jgi:hypothetical protein